MSHRSCSSHALFKGHTKMRKDAKRHRKTRKKREKTQYHHDVSSCPFDLNPKSSLLSFSVHPVAPGGQNLQGSTFMDIEKLINLLTTPIDMPLPTIPEGRKENKFFLINNERNIIRSGSDLGCTFSDDCGAWKHSPSAVSRMMKKQGKWKSVILKKGIYGTEKWMSGEKVFVSLEQQPTKDEVLKVHRIYNILKADASYKRRVSWLEPSPIPLASVEYLGMFQGAQIHGNSKNKKDPYVRTNPKVFDDIRENCCATKPREVYEELKKVPNEQQRPVDLRQVQNISYNFHRKKRFEEGTLGCGKNLADNMQHIHNVIHSHPFVQAIFHIKNHVPSMFYIQNIRLKISDVWIARSVAEIRLFLYRFDGYIAFMKRQFLLAKYVDRNVSAHASVY